MKLITGIFTLGTFGLAACRPEFSEGCSGAVTPYAQARALAVISTEIQVDFTTKHQEPVFRQCGDIVRVSYFLREVDGLTWVGGYVHYHVSLADGTIVKTELGE